MKIYRVLAVAMIVGLMAVVAAGCGGPKTTPEQAAQIYSNLMAKGDLSEVDKIGMPEEVKKSFSKQYDAAMKKSAVSLFKSIGVHAAGYTGGLPDVLKEVQKKIEITTRLVSKEGDSAVVNISVRTIDGVKVGAEVVGPPYQAELDKNKYMTDDKKADALKRAFKENLDKITLVAEAKSFEAKFIVDKDTDCWKPEDMKSFMEQLASLYNW